jgi:hypothetical protein
MDEYSHARTRTHAHRAEPADLLLHDRNEDMRASRRAERRNVLGPDEVKRARGGVSLCEILTSVRRYSTLHVKSMQNVSHIIARTKAYPPYQKPWKKTRLERSAHTRTRASTHFFSAPPHCFRYLIVGSEASTGVGLLGPTTKRVKSLATSSRSACPSSRVRVRSLIRELLYILIEC